VVLQAELYNASYELVNTAEVNITLTTRKGRNILTPSSRTEAPTGSMPGNLAPGRYTYTARTSLDGESLSAQGEFLVKALMAERMSTVADRAVMADIAARTQGMIVGPNELDTLSNALIGGGKLVSRSYRQASFSDLIGLRWIFFILLALLTAEWMLRRRSGAY
jgi:hypothetical protein